MIYVVDSTGYSMRLSNELIWSIVGVIAGIYALFYVFRSIGIYKLAKNNGVRNAYLAWIPFAWSFTAGKLVEDRASVFGRRIKKFGAVFCAVYSTMTALSIAYYILTYLPIVGYFLHGYNTGESVVYIALSSGSLANFNAVRYPLSVGLYTGSNFLLTYSQPIKVLYYILSGLSTAAMIVMIVFEVALYIHIFKKFWPQHSWAATIFSIAGLFPIMLFIVRNKREINYEDFMRAKYGVQYGNQSETFQDYNERARHGKKEESPFDEFNTPSSRRNDDPFSEFGNDDK